MDMPNEYYNQGRRGRQPGGMPYQTPMGGMHEPIATFPNFTPMGGGNMSGPVATFPNSTPMGGGVGNYPMGPTNPLPVPGPRNRGTRIPGGPLQESPLRATYYPPPWPPKGSTGTYDPPPIPGQPWPRPSGPPMKQPSPMPGDRGGTRIPGGPLQESPLRPRGNRQASMMAPANRGTGMVQSRGQQDQAAWRASQRAGDSGQYQDPNSTARLRNYGTSRPTYASPQGGMNQAPPMSGGRGTYDTGGLSPYGGTSNYPRSPGMPTPRTPRRMSNFGSMGGYPSRQPAMTFNQGNTNINNQLTQQGPRIARNQGRMGGYNPMMYGGQSRQIGGLRNLMQMLAAMRGGRR